MARQDMNTMMTSSEMIVAMIAQPFQAFGAAIARMSENTARTAALTQLNAMTDEDLAKRGLTRAQAAQLMLRSQF